jgi:lysophospholipase L1-like esterase
MRGIANSGWWRAVALVVLVGGAVTGIWFGLGLGAAPGQPASAVSHLAPTPTPTTETDGAYAVIDAAGGVATYGGAGYAGDTLDLTLHQPIVGGAADPNGGYWLVAADGGVFSFGGAPFYGSTGADTLNQPIVGMAATPDGKGYWLVAADGGVFTFGDAPFLGSTGAMTLNKPVVGMAANPDGKGYWLVAADGGIFTFGNAPFSGSAGAFTLNQPIVGMAATKDGRGYWLVAADGGIFTFGDAPFDGSMGGTTLDAPITGINATPDGGGYWMVGQDGGVFTFGDAGYAGSAESPLHVPLFPVAFSTPIAPVVAIIPDGPGPQSAHQGPLRVAFAGDSNGFYEGQYTLDTGPPFLVDDGAAPGCGYTNGDITIPWSKPKTFYEDPVACTLWASQVQWVTARFHPDVTVIQLGYWEAQLRLFDGAYATLDTPAYAAYIQANMEQAVQIAHAGGGAVILNTSPYFNDRTPDRLVDAFNQIVRTVASENPSFVSVFDAFSLLDPGSAYATTVDGVVARGTDGVHLTQDGVDTVLLPSLTQLIESVGQPVYAGNG